MAGLPPRVPNPFGKISTGGAMADKPKYSFGTPRTSGLSAIADKMWDQSKKDFGEQSHKSEIKLEHKNLSDVLGKMKHDNDKVKGPLDGTKSASPAAPFVFGQKLSERVIQPTHADTSSSPTKAEDLFKNAGADKPKSTGLSTENGSSAASTAERLRADAEHVSAEEKKEHDRQLASTSVIEVRTGEENDENLHTFVCKVHSFDRSKNGWAEKGQCQLKINRLRDPDDDGWGDSPVEEHYRIVARTVGTMKIVINSPVFRDMLVEKVDERRTKITAVEGGLPHIFLLTTSGGTGNMGEQLRTALGDVKRRVRVTQGTDDDDSRKGKKRRAEGDVEADEPETKKLSELEVESADGETTDAPSGAESVEDGKEEEEKKKKKEDEEEKKDDEEKKEDEQKEEEKEMVDGEASN